MEGERCAEVGHWKLDRSGGDRPLRELGLKFASGSLADISILCFWSVRLLTLILTFRCHRCSRGRDGRCRDSHL